MLSFNHLHALTQPLTCSHATTCMLSRNHLHALIQPLACFHSTTYMLSLNHLHALTQPLACSHSTTYMLSRNHLHALSQGVRSGKAVSQERIPPRSPLHQSWRPHQYRSSCSISRDLLASAHCCYFLLTHPFQRRTGIIIIYQSPCSADTEGDGERRERGPNRGGEEQGLTARA